MTIYYSKRSRNVEIRNWEIGFHAFVLLMNAFLYTSRLRPASQFMVHGCAYALPGVAEGEAWVISPEFLLSKFKFQAVNGYSEYRALIKSSVSSTSISTSTEPSGICFLLTTRAPRRLEFN